MNAALAVHSGRNKASRIVPLDLFDLDDVCAHIGQHQPDHRTGHDVSKLYDATTGKGAGH